MKYIALFFVGFGLLISVFQGCGNVHSAKQTTDLSSLSSLYPFAQDTRYFDDVQVSFLERGEGSTRINLDIAIVDVDEEDQLTDVEIQFLGQDGEILCPRHTATVSRLDNHIQIDNCQVYESVEILNVQVFAAPTGESLTLVREHFFDLN